MKTSDIISQVIAEVDRSDLTRVMVLQYLNNRQSEIINYDDWSFMEQTSSSPTVASQQSYTIPDDYKDELQLWLVDSTTTVKTPLVKWVGSEAEKNYSQPNFTARPFAYWVWQNAYYLYPIPDTTYTLWLKYYKYIIDLTDVAIEENELVQRYPKLLMFGAISDVFHYFHEPDKSGQWESKYTTQFKILQRREGKRIFPNYDRRLRIRMK
jgi:hypothetical protein